MISLDLSLILKEHFALLNETSSRKLKELIEKVISISKQILEELFYLVCLFIIYPCWCLVKFFYKYIIKEIVKNSLEVIALIRLIFIELKSSKNYEIKDQSWLSCNESNLSVEMIETNENNNNNNNNINIACLDNDRIKFKSNLKRYILKNRLKSGQSRIHSSFYVKRACFFKERRSVVAQLEKKMSTNKKSSNTTFIIKHKCKS
jgi:hypothetical protein